MKKLILTSAIALALAGCSDAPTNSTEVTQDSTADVVAMAPIGGIDLDAMDLSVKPGDDFNAYVNGAWLNTFEIPADKTSYGVFGRLRDKSISDVREIILESAKNSEAGTDEQKVGDMYNSYTNWEAREALGIKPLISEFEKIAALEKSTDLAAYFGYLSTYGIDSPLGMGQYVDFTDPNTYMVYAAQGGLGLPDKEFYVKDDAKSVEIREKYVAHIEAMLKLAELPDAAESAKAIMALETQIASHHMSKEDSRNMTKIYNKIAIADLPSIMPTFDWDAYLTSTQMKDKLTHLIVMSPDYSTALDKMLNDVDMETWKTYLSWKVIDASASKLTKALDEQNFEFYAKTLKGVEEQEPEWKRAVGLVNGTLGEVVGKVYVAKHFPPAAKAKMEELVHNLILAYEQSIKNLEWMTEETKVQALDKLHKFTPKIGYPDEWKDYSALEVASDDLYGNLRRVAQLNWAEKVERQDQPVDRGEWAMNPQTVNAYYNPPLNEIVFPAAILQPPFFNMDAEDAVNYGAIGGVIGHEIGHGFDDSGSRFDGNGVLRDWWAEQAKSECNARNGKWVAQYDAYAPIERVQVSGNFTLGENIGDLGGLSIGLKAYHLALGDTEAPIIDGFTGDQRVFLGWAQVWRNKYRDDALRNLINTDPHAPSMYRVNGIVRNVPEFYEAFSVGEGDALYLAPEDRVKIW